MNLRVLHLAFSSHTDFVGSYIKEDGKSLIECRWNEGGWTSSDRSSIAYTPPSAQLKRGVAGQKWLWVALMVIIVFIRQQGQSPVLVQVYVILGDSKLVTWPNTSVTGSVPAHLAGYCNRANRIGKIQHTTKSIHGGKEVPGGGRMGPPMYIYII